jgi:choline dehydrogenase
MGAPLRDEHWDDVVVGAGSCGAVLAARLSERPDRSVLLLEAGPDRGDPAEPPSGGPPDAPILSGSNWDYEASIGSAQPGGRRSPYRVGRLVGGSSAVNGAIALWGLAEDFDSWAAAGNRLWSWAEVRPSFVGLERDLDFGGADHGTDGPVPIVRRRVEALDDVAVAFWRTCRQLGIPDLPDLNRGSAVGVGRVPTNTCGGRRMSTARTHLAAARGRPNLTVRDGCQVHRVLFDGERAVGVEIVAPGGPATLSAGRVTLAAGAVNTPLILERSGARPTCTASGRIWRTTPRWSSGRCCAPTPPARSARRAR